MSTRIGAQPTVRPRTRWLLPDIACTRVRPRMELTDRSVVITGAGSGIGRALAERFAAERPRALILADVNQASVEEVAEALGERAVPVTVDVGREEEIRALVDRAREVAGPVDPFCSNAGVPGPGGGPEASDAEWERTWRSNVVAHIW